MSDLPDYSGKRFMLVDDVPYMTDVLADLLKRCGVMECEKFSSPQDAIARLATHSFDCVISDFNMKPVTGLQFLQALRMGARPHLPRDQRFILVTGHGEVEVVKAAKSLDVTAYLVKPVSLANLIKVLERAFQGMLSPKEAGEYRAIGLPRP